MDITAKRIRIPVIREGKWYRVLVGTTSDFAFFSFMFLFLV